MATIKAGTYRFNDVINPPKYDYITCTANMRFVCEQYPNIEFIELRIASDGEINYVVQYQGDSTTAEVRTPYRDGVWVSEAAKTITVLIGAEDEPLWDVEYFNENTQMLIKAGQYRWNDELSVPIDDTMPYEISFDYISDSVRYYQIGVEYAIEIDLIVLGYIVDDLNIKFAYSNTDFENLVKGWADSGSQTITTTEDQYVLTTFGLWANENWQPYSEEALPAVEITYKGETISLEAGDVATLHIKDHKLTEDLVIKANATGGSGGGSCSGNHIIEVEELPTEGIDENALYKCGESYYKYYASAFSDVVMNTGAVDSLVEMLTSNEGTVELYQVTTKPTENIIASDLSSHYAFYYVEDESDIFLYNDDFGWITLSMMFDGQLTFKGAISNMSEATEMGYYAVVGSGWDNYILPNGDVTIVRSGTFDVAKYKSVKVDVATTYTVQTVDELPTDAPNGSLAFVLGGE